MDGWLALLDIMVLLLAAIVLGTLCERLKQSAILGYLLAGMVFGPGMLDLTQNHVTVSTIAELGVALLLFSIGLEFSWRRLRGIGPIALGGGSLQVVLTGAAAAGAGLLFGLGGTAAVAVGATIALSSTAGVIRVLASRAEIDSVHGRNALGILLLQDIAVVPLALLVTALGTGGSLIRIGWEMARALGMGALLVATLFLLVKYVMPRILGAEAAVRNRELPILFAIVTAVGAALVSHKLGLSPVLGAFVAGILLAESPFASQIRADVAPLRTLFVTLFFASIGMFIDPVWIFDHWTILAAATAAVILGKTLIAALVAFLFRYPPGQALATGLCLAQVGEFSFVLAASAVREDLIGAGDFDLIVSVTVVSLFLTPFLIAAAPRLSDAAARLAPRSRRPQKDDQEEPFDPAADAKDRFVIVGFGPAGQRVAEFLGKERDEAIVVVDQNPRSANRARSMGLRSYIGDATRLEILDYLKIERARAVAVTAPDPRTARQIVAQIRVLSPGATIVVRSRYHIHGPSLLGVGAHAVVDEEEEVGRKIATQVLEAVGEPEGDAADSGKRSETE